MDKANGDQPHGQTDQGGDNRCRQVSDPGGEAGLGDQQGAPVGPRTVEDGVVELVHAAETEHQVETGGQQAGHQDLRHKVDVEPGNKPRGQEKNHQGPQDQPPGISPLKAQRPAPPSELRKAILPGAGILLPSVASSVVAIYRSEKRIQI